MADKVGFKYGTFTTGQEIKEKLNPGDIFIDTNPDSSKRMGILLCTSSDDGSKSLSVMGYGAYQYNNTFHGNAKMNKNLWMATDGTDTATPGRQFLHQIYNSRHGYGLFTVIPREDGTGIAATRPLVSMWAGETFGGKITIEGYESQEAAFTKGALPILDAFILPYGFDVAKYREDNINACDPVLSFAHCQGNYCMTKPDGTKIKDITGLYINPELTTNARVGIVIDGKTDKDLVTANGSTVNIDSLPNKAVTYLTPVDISCNLTTNPTLTAAQKSAFADPMQTVRLTVPDTTYYYDMVPYAVEGGKVTYRLAKVVGVGDVQFAVDDNGKLQYTIMTIADQIGEGTITGDKIADGAINTPKILDNTVTTDKIVQLVISGKTTEISSFWGNALRNLAIKESTPPERWTTPVYYMPIESAGDMATPMPLVGVSLIDNQGSQILLHFSYFGKSIIYKNPVRHIPSSLYWKDVTVRLEEGYDLWTVRKIEPLSSSLQDILNSDSRYLNGSAIQNNTLTVDKLKDASVTPSKLAPSVMQHLEAITIYTDNTDEHKAANVANIKAYEDNLKLLGVDVTKSPMIPYKDENYHPGFIQLAEDPGDYRGWMRNEELMPYEVRIDTDGTYYETSLIEEDLFFGAIGTGKLTTTAKQIIPAINEVNTLAKSKASTAVATTSANGLMSSGDKVKLDGVADGATKVTTDTVSGWGYTKNTGTVTGVKINGTTKTPTSGIVDLGTVITDISGKVDKVSGKQLSTNDYTTAEKNKLAGLTNYTLPTASATVKGGVKVGSGLFIASDGTLSADAGDLSDAAVLSQTIRLSSRINETDVANIKTRMQTYCEVMGLDGSEDFSFDVPVWCTQGRGVLILRYTVATQKIVLDGTVSLGTGISDAAITRVVIDINNSDNTFTYDFSPLNPDPTVIDLSAVTDFDSSAVYTKNLLTKDIPNTIHRTKRLLVKFPLSANDKTTGTSAYAAMGECAEYTMTLDKYDPDATEGVQSMLFSKIGTTVTFDSLYYSVILIQWNISAGTYMFVYQPLNQKKLIDESAIASQLATI